MKNKATTVILILLSLSIFIPGQVLAQDAGRQGSTEPLEELEPGDGAYMPGFIGELTIQEEGVESITVARSHWNELWGSPHGEVCYEVDSRQNWWCEDNPNQ